MYNTRVKIIKKMEYGLEMFYAYLICKDTDKVLTQAHSMSYLGVANIIHNKRRRMQRGFY